MTHAADPLDTLRSALADRYAIERELGAGGMPTGYLAGDGAKLIVVTNWLGEVRTKMRGQSQEVEHAR